MRYTLQWLVEPDVAKLQYTPHNMDAAFKTGSRKKKPSDLLLHYNYGAAAVKWWGHGEIILQNRPHLPRPVVCTPAPVGPSKPIHDWTTVIRKLDAVWGRDQAGAGNVAAGDQPGEVMEDRTTWDEDDVMLFFWGNSPAAMKRHHKKQEERTQYMEQWRSEVA